MANVRDSLFYFDKGEIRFNELGILFNPSFTKLFRRKHEIAGDSQGRAKLRNFQEAKYIYFIADPQSIPNRRGYKDSQAHDYAVENAGLPPTWVPDEVVSACISIYRADSWDTVREQIFELNATFRGFNKVISLIRENIDTLIQQPKLKKEEISEILGYYKQLLTIASDIPKVQTQLNDAIKLLDEAAGDDEWTHMRGSKIAPPSSADPENELRV